MPGNPQRNIALAVGAGSSTAVALTLITLMLIYNFSIVPSDHPDAQNNSTTIAPVIQSPSQLNNPNAAGAPLLTAIGAGFSLLGALYVAFFHAGNEITGRQRGLAVASGVLGMLAAADAVALPIVSYNLRNQVPLAVLLAFIVPGFIAGYAFFVTWMIHLYRESRESQQPELRRDAADHLHQPLTGNNGRRAEEATTTMQQPDGSYNNDNDNHGGVVPPLGYGSTTRNF